MHRWQHQHAELQRRIGAWPTALRWITLPERRDEIGRNILKSARPSAGDNPLGRRQILGKA
jgi:hypothetical protein